MITQLSEETINEYALEAQTTQQPTGADFTQGVSVGRTIPAKWWNWLFNAVTKRIFQGKNDSQNILTELQNVVTDAGIELDDTDNTQLSQAVSAKADEQIDLFIDKKRGYFINWFETPRPAAPDYWTPVVGGLSISNCTCHVLYREGAGAIRDTLKVAFNVDGKSWTPYVDIHLTNGIVPSYICHVVIHKFKGRYFLYVDGTISGSWQNGHAGEMFVSDDLKTWTSMFHIYYYHSNQAATSNGEYPSFAWSDDALYFMSKEGESASATTKLRATYDGYNWTEIATGFSYLTSRVPSEGLKVIPYGTNGFLWGFYAFDGTNFAPVNTNASDNYYAGIYNPLILSSGKVFYQSGRSDDKCFIAPNPGAQAVLVPLSEALPYAGRGRLVLNGRYVAFGGNNINGYCVTLDSVKLVDDTGTVTTFPHPPREEGATVDFLPFDINGITYCGRYKTTSDFDHWEMVQNLPEGLSADAFIFDCVDRRMIGFTDYRYNSSLGKYLTFVSKDEGAVWREQNSSRMIRGNILFDDCCWGGSDTTAGGSVSYNSSNRVIGNTLYLR